MSWTREFIIYIDAMAIFYTIQVYASSHLPVNSQVEYTFHHMKYI